MSKKIRKNNKSSSNKSRTYKKIVSAGSIIPSVSPSKAPLASARLRGGSSGFRLGTTMAKAAVPAAIDGIGSAGSALGKKMTNLRRRTVRKAPANKSKPPSKPPIKRTNHHFPSRTSPTATNPLHTTDVPPSPTPSPTPQSNNNVSQSNPPMNISLANKLQNDNFISFICSQTLGEKIKRQLDLKQIIKTNTNPDIEIDYNKLILYKTSQEDNDESGCILNISYLERILSSRNLCNEIVEKFVIEILKLER